MQAEAELSDFNSLQVQLIGGKQGNSARAGNHFNSLQVQLIVILQVILTYPYLNFNSLQVQLIAVDFYKKNYS